MKKQKFEAGNAVIEFIALFLLLALPLFSYFGWITVSANSQLKAAEMIREVSQILRTGNDFNTSVSISKRYLALQGMNGELAARCITGICPRRGSVMEIELKVGKHLYRSFIKGGRWQ